MQTVSDALRWWAHITPDVLALSIDGDAISYRALYDWSGKIAARLLAMGLVPGDRVSIAAANSANYCALIAGIIRAGGTVAPLNMRYTKTEVAELVEDQTPRFAFADEARLGLFEGLEPELFDLGVVRDWRDDGLADPRVAHDPDQAVVIIATSGSTAKPKGVMLTHRSMTSYAAAWAVEEPHCAKGARIIVPAPLSTSAGFVQLIHYTVLGCSLHFVSAFDPDAFLDLIVTKRITGFGGVPLFFERIAQTSGFARADLSSVTMATTGGAAVPRALQDVWGERGVVLRQIYGQTEAGGNATIMPEALAGEFPEKCGRGGVFTELAIAGEDGAHLPAGELGEIVLRGPGIMKGYWNNPEETGRALKQGWLHTGDLGTLDERGLLQFVDRKKDIIISGGLNISAAEVERAVAGFDGVAEVMVIAAKDAKFGETPMAVIHATTEIDVAALIAHCNDRLADFKVPRYVAIEAEPLPRTATGKLAKPVMRDKYRDAATTLRKVR